MKVKELIEKLQQLDENLDICILHDDYGFKEIATEIKNDLMKDKETQAYTKKIYYLV